MAKRFSPWFKARLAHPARPGLYQISTGKPIANESVRDGKLTVPANASDRFRYWDGEAWFMVSNKTFAATIPAAAFGKDRYQSWRGLTKAEYHKRSK